MGHRLAPLSSCLPTVAQEFLSSAARLKLLPQAFLSSSPASVRAQRPLELFFPFDPYLLRTSAARLKLNDSYIRWSGRPGAEAAQGDPLDGRPLMSCCSQEICLHGRMDADCQLALSL